MSEMPGATGFRRHLAAVVRSLLIAAAMLLIYSVAPVTGSAPRWGSMLLFLVGLVALVAVTVVMVRRARAEPDARSISVEAVIALGYAVLAFFSLTYLALAQREGQFVDLHNRVDALYFTVVTLATVGYGDVHPVGTAARAAVTLQILFDITLLAVAIRVIGGALAARREQEDSPSTGEAPR